MNCPDCDYSMSPFDKDCPRCKAFAAKGITVRNRPAEEKSAASEAKMRQIAQQVVQEAGGPVPPAPTPSAQVPQSHPLAITSLWSLTVIEWFLMFSPDTLPIAYFFDLVALIIAVFLVCQRAGADKANGWVKIALEVVGFFWGVAHSQAPQPPSGY